MGRRNRIIEIAISVAASIITSGFIGSWWISAKLTNYDNSITALADSVAALNQSVLQNRTTITTVEGVNANQSAEIAVSNARYSDIVRRLDSIEGKVDNLASRR